MLGSLPFLSASFTHSSPSPACAFPWALLVGASLTAALGVATVAAVQLGRGSGRWRWRRRTRCGASAPLVFETCEAFRVRSSEGLRYKVTVSLPLGYDRPEEAGLRYPVVLALDAEPYLFPLLATAARTNHFFKRSSWYPDLIVVGVCADLERGFRGSRGALDVRGLWDALRPTRARDYLPTAAESPWGAPGAEPLLHVSGHATTFVRFLASSLIPLIDSKYRTSKGDRALVGKSFGGSAVLHAMLDQECSPLFSHYLLGSPSISWDDRAFFRLEEESHKSRRPLSAAVYYAVGGREPSQPGSARDFERVLCSRGYPDLSITVDVVEGEDHGSLSYPFVCRGLNWLAASLARSRA